MFRVDNLRYVPASEKLNRQEIVLTNGSVEVGVDTFGGFIEFARVDGFDLIVPRTENNLKRSGIPRLGPVAGPVAGTDWEKLYLKMPSHGHDRHEPMGLIGFSDNVVLLEKTEGPIQFKGVWRTELEVEATTDGLVITQRVTNLEDKPSVRAVAFHPYFPGDITVIEPESISVVPDYKQSIMYPGSDGVIFTVGGREVTFEFSPTPEKIVDWRETDAHRCIEPWWAKKGDGWVFGPREEVAFRMKISSKKV